MTFRTVSKLNTINPQFPAVFLLVVLTGCTVFCQNRQTSANQHAGRPLNMLILGDSIMWGQGLKTEHKSWYHVKVWLEKTSGQAVIEKIEAHSGAVVERSSTPERLTAPNAEVDVALP